MAARAYSQADIVLSAWCHPDRVPDGVFFKVSRPLHRPAFFRHHRCRSGSGTDALVFTIGQEPSIFTNGYLASHRRLLRGAGGPYFSRVVGLMSAGLHSVWSIWISSAVLAFRGSFPWQQGKDGMGSIFARIAPIPTFPRSRGKEWNGDYEITSHSIRSVTLGINHVETI